MPKEIVKPVRKELVPLILTHEKLAMKEIVNESTIPEIEDTDDEQ